MPPFHPAFDLITYRTPRGVQTQKDVEAMVGSANEVNLNFTSELIMGTAHTGTHIDALCHVSQGIPDRLFGDVPVDGNLGDFGALTLDASEFPPIISRGVLLDVPRALGQQHCEPGYQIAGTDLASAADRQGTELRAGDTVLVRTGEMSFWPDEEAMEAAHGSGVSLDGAQWLALREPLVSGCDNANYECMPSGIEGDPFPVHRHLMQECGIPIMEWVDCEELASEGTYEFLFVCLPLTVTGATGSMVNPIAVT